MSNTETIIIVLSNSLTAILAAALILIVMWQAPQKRTNQALALMMLCLTVFSGLNTFSRFLERFNTDPAQFWYAVFASYGMFSLSTYLFALTFTGLRERWTMICLALTLLVTPVSLIALWTGSAIIDVHPSGGGAYTYTYGPMYVFTALNTLAPYVGTLLLIYRANTRWARMLIPALICILIGMLSSVLRPLIGALPINALMLAAATLLIGRTVIQSQLFNPLAELNQQLSQKNRELAETSHLKTRFLANMSHELRTPLNSIIGYTGLILDGTYGPLTEKQQDRLEKVTRNGQHLLSVINDVLDLNRIEAGEITLNRTSVSVKSLLDHVFGLIEPLASHKGLTLTRSDPANLPLLNVDEQRARQMLINVISNAVKFTPTGHVAVRVLWEVDHELRIEVEDSGIGIEESQQKIVFEEFRQVDSTATREFQGTGLGLAITRRLVELHGGRIWFTSQPGKGTTFYLTLPCANPLNVPLPDANSANLV